MNRNQLTPALTVLCGLLILTPGKARAGNGDFSEPLGAPVHQDGASGEWGIPGWDIQFRPYLWTAAIEGDVGVRDVTVPVDVGFDDILDSLDFSFASTLDVRRDGSKWGAFFDVFYVKLSPDLGRPSIGPLEIRGLEIEQAIIDAFLTYRLTESERGWVDVFGGAAWMYLKNTIETRNNLTSTRRKLEKSQDWLDPSFGIRGRYNVTEKLYLAGAASIGGFGVGSDLTYQLAGGLGYYVTEQLSLEAMYRFLSVDYDDDGFLYDTDTSGLFLGAAIYF